MAVASTLLLLQGTESSPPMVVKAEMRTTVDEVFPEERMATGPQNTEATANALWSASGAGDPLLMPTDAEIRTMVGGV